MQIRSFAQLLEAAIARGPARVAVAAADEANTLAAVSKARDLGLATAVLFGDEAAIRQTAEAAGVNLSGLLVVHVPNHKESVRAAVASIKDGVADMAMNGRAQPGHLVRVALEPEMELRTGKLFTDVSIFEIPGLDRLILISDIGVVVSPTLEEKVSIVQNAIDVAHALGIEKPKVAVLAATEMVNPKIPVSMDASNLSKMAQRGQIKGGIVDGPLALDNAISPHAAKVKGIQSDVAGYADILIVPDVDAGNILAKAITYFARGKMAGVVVGSRSLLIMPSRADPPETKLMSIALGVYLAMPPK
ncbi:MAG: bifunctional enoyl-CoA hydratase/phosphate acetyltransferase [Anaerolineae bacterium]|nr:bifunctional enoyl-CoA hydratase/phosphate acetyltransferase [Anaerolineae bacterium]